MAYQVLARKWRPQTFEDLVGQEFAALTLKNSIDSGKIAHALIFAGPRGIGKTSTARIVAKAINCEKKDSGTYPCKENQCNTCHEISEGKSLDVHEIDAASHTGVNDIREIIENVKYMPTSARKKVYIIDEVHMLSQSAFNALLKTLEEPPEHVLFILATTEIHKIPSTILSRCQRYDFKKVSSENIKKTLSEITSAENVDIDEKTLYLIAKESDGSLRDSLSLLDQLIATFDGKIEYEKVIDILGLLDNNSLNKIVESIFNREPKKCIELIYKADNRGISPRRLLNDLTRVFQNLVYIKICGNDFISDLTEDEIKQLAELIKGQSAEALDIILNILIDASEKVPRSFHPKIILELTLIKLCTVSNLSGIDEIINKLESLSESAHPNEIKRASAEKKNEDQVESKEQKRNRYEIKNLKKNNNEPNNIKHDKDINKEHENQAGSIPTGDKFIELINENNKFLGMRLENSQSIEINGSSIKIRFPVADINYEYFKKPANLNSFRELVTTLFSVNDPQIELQIETGIIHNGKQKKKKKVNQKDPLIEETIKIFNGKLLKTKAVNKE